MMNGKLLIFNPVFVANNFAGINQSPDKVPAFFSDNPDRMRIAGRDKTLIHGRLALQELQ